MASKRDLALRLPSFRHAVEQPVFEHVPRHDRSAAQPAVPLVVPVLVPVFVVGPPREPTVLPEVRIPDSTLPTGI